MYNIRGISNKSITSDNNESNIVRVYLLFCRGKKWKSGAALTIRRCNL